MTARAVGFLRHLAGFAIAPAVAPVAALGYEVFRMSVAEAEGGPVMAAFTRSPLDLLVSFATTWLPAGYAVAIVLGVPIVLALRAARRLTVPWVVGVSAAFSGAVVIAGMLVADGEVAAEDLGGALVLAGIAAALAAAVSGAHCAIAGLPLRETPARPPPAAPGS